LVEGDTPCGAFVVEWDAAGNLVAQSIELRTPPPQPPSDSPKRPPCNGCGGNRNNPLADYNVPGGADAVIQQMD